MQQSPSASYVRQFEALDTWGRTRDTVDADERDRVDAVVDAVPAGAGTILDVGCGDGLITNELVDRGFDVVGLDVVPELLRHVRAPTVEGRADALPFPDGSFDCVLSAAVVEHLTAGMFERTLTELARLAAHTIVISTPYREDLVLMQARCMRCASTFHASHHVRSVDERDVAAWFPAFDVRSVRLGGPHLRRRSRALQRLAQLLGGAWYRGEGIVCPTCGSDVPPASPNRAVWAVNGILQRIVGLMQGSRPSVLVVVLERRS